MFAFVAVPGSAPGSVLFCRKPTQPPTESSVINNMPARILLIGSTGQVGSDLNLALPRLGSVVPLNRAQLDQIDGKAMRAAIRGYHPDVVVNAAAYTAVDQAESEPEIAEAVNAVAPQIMAEEARSLGFPLVHYSTDYVFDGTKGSPYAESDATNPLGVYGRTKLRGEQGIRETGADHLILRTSWIYDTRGRNFLLAVLRLAASRDELRIVNDQHGAPTWSRAVAFATMHMLDTILSLPQEQRSKFWGTYHVTAAGETTWCEFARAILANCTDAHILTPELRDKVGAGLQARSVVPISTAEYPTPARRPLYSVLSNDKLERTFQIALSSWQEQLRMAMLSGSAAPLVKSSIAAHQTSNLPHPQ